MSGTDWIHKSSVERWNDYAALVQKIATVLAIIAAGWWFLVRGENLARANVNHEVDVVQIAANRFWLNLKITIENTGNKTLVVRKIKTHVEHVLPLTEEMQYRLEIGESLMDEDETRVEWLTLGSREVRLQEEVRPSESVTIPVEIEINGSPDAGALEVFRVYSFVSQSAARIPGWSNTTIHSTSEATGASS